MYECVICHSVNHDSRIRCAVCGTTPAAYSVTCKASKLNSDLQCIEVVAAYGVSRSCEHHAARMNLRTVELDYYADGSAD